MPGPVPTGRTPLKPPHMGGGIALTLRAVAVLAALIYLAYRSAHPAAPLTNNPAATAMPAPPMTATMASTPRAESANAEANALFIQARAKGLDRSRRSTAAAIDLLQKAVRLDPRFTRAWAELAVLLGVVDASMDPIVRHPRAKAAADRAMAIDKAAAPALAALAFVHYRFEWQWAQADAEFTKAIAADQNDAFAHHQYGVFLAAMGRTDDALRELERAAELDPGSAAIRADMVAPLLRAGRVAGAEGQGEHGVDTRTVEQRIRQLTAEVEHGPSPPTSYRLATDLALAHASLKHRDQTLHWLAVAIDLHEDAPLYMRSSPAFDFVRDEPRFKELLRRAKLDQIGQ